MCRLFAKNTDTDHHVIISIALSMVFIKRVNKEDPDGWFAFQFCGSNNISNAEDERLIIDVSLQSIIITNMQILKISS